MPPPSTADLAARAKATTPERVRTALKRGVRGYAMLTSPLRSWPTYLIIGGKRCGTTSLHRYLLQHPDVAPLVPAVQGIKGVHYFDRAPNRSPAWYRSHFPVSRPGRGPRHCGEASPYYLYHPCAAERAARVVPDAKLIVLLREPAARAWSHYRDEVKNGRESLPFDEALAAEDARTAAERRRLEVDDRYTSEAHEHLTYVDQGRYAVHLARWLAVYPRERLCVLRSEDLFADPRSVHRQVLEFLGLDDVPLPAYERHNPSPALAADGAALAALRSFYAPYDDELSSILGGWAGWPQPVTTR